MTGWLGVFLVLVAACAGDAPTLPTSTASPTSTVLPASTVSQAPAPELDPECAHFPDEELREVSGLPVVAGEMSAARIGPDMGPMSEALFYCLWIHQVGDGAQSEISILGLPPRRDLYELWSRSDAEPLDLGSDAYVLEFAACCGWRAGALTDDLSVHVTVLSEGATRRQAVEILEAALDRL